MADGTRRRGPVGGSALAERVIGALLFAAVFLGTLFWGALPFTFGVAIASVIGSVELFNMFEKKGQAIPTAAIIGIAGSLAYVFLAYFRPIESFGYVTVGIVFLAFLWYMAVLRHVKPTGAVALTVLASLLTGLCLSHLVLLRDIVKIKGGDHPNNGLWIVVFLILLVWVYDVSAWAVGRKLGRHKIAPNISPNKSLEGAIAGTIGVLAASVVFRMLIQWILGKNRFEWFSIGVALIIGVIVVVLGPLGDLSESLMKREYGLKDTGSLIPGHGGIMDRFDSTLFTAPAVFYFLFYFVIEV